MPFDLPVLLDYFSTAAILSLLASSYRFVRRSMRTEASTQVVLGVFFGAITFLQMHAPLQPVPGLIMDLRAVPIALAGGFLGWRGLVPCLTIAVATRASVGGVGAEAGILAILIIGVVAFAWGETMRARGAEGSPKSLAILGLAAGLDTLAVGVLPPEMALMVVRDILPWLLPLEVVGIVGVGMLLVREGAMFEGERALRAAASTDPGSGLLTEAGLERSWAHVVADGATSRGTGLVLLRLHHADWIARQYGQGALDLVRGALRQRLERELPRADVLALLDGGDIAIVLLDRSARDQALLLATVEREAFVRPVRLPDGTELRPSCLIGQTWDDACRPLDVQVNEARASLEHNSRLRDGRAAAPTLDVGAARDALFARAERLSG